MNKAKVKQLIHDAFQYAEVCDACGKTVHYDDVQTNWETPPRAVICNSCLGKAWRDARKKAAKKGKR